MNHPKILYQFKECAGESFMPSNGTEGMMFTEAFCDQCIHEKFSHTQKHGDKQCGIMDNSMIYWYEDNYAEKVPEWKFDSEGWPHCTAWEKWDWGNDDEGFNEPPIPPPLPDPRQLNIFPLYLGKEFIDKPILQLLEK